MAARKPSGKRMAQYYRDLWESEAGRHVLADLMTRSGVLSPARSLEGEDITDHGGLAMAEGMRRVGLHIVDQLTAKPSDFVDVSRDAFDVIGHYYNTNERIEH